MISPKGVKELFEEGCWFANRKERWGKWRGDWPPRKVNITQQLGERKEPEKDDQKEKKRAVGG